MSAPARERPPRAAVSRRPSPPSASGSAWSPRSSPLAGVGWWWTAQQMRGMDEGPWTGLGTLGWFLGVWVVMMAAMMFPSVAPTVALYSRMTKQRSPLSPLLFAGGLPGHVGRRGSGRLRPRGGPRPGRGRRPRLGPRGPVGRGRHAGRRGGLRADPLKDVCLGKCRSPLGFLLGSWRDGRWGALRMGAKNGAWCVGCCWALMASLFALGVMSVTWMAVRRRADRRREDPAVAPRRDLRDGGRAARPRRAAARRPDAIPALTVPGAGPMGEMEPMGS